MLVETGSSTGGLWKTTMASSTSSGCDSVVARTGIASGLRLRRGCRWKVVSDLQAG